MVFQCLTPEDSQLEIFFQDDMTLDMTDNMFMWNLNDNEIKPIVTPPTKERPIGLAGKEYPDFRVTEAFLNRCLMTLLLYLTVNRISQVRLLREKPPLLRFDLVSQRPYFSILGRVFTSSFGVTG